MAVKIRLRRTGKRNAPAHRIVAADTRSPRDGSFIETLGTYDPRAKIEKIDLERVDHWLSRGAMTSETVDGIIKRARGGISLYDRRVKREQEERKQAEEAARKKAEAEAAAAEEEAGRAAVEETEGAEETEGGESDAPAQATATATDVESGGSSESEQEYAAQ